jgi:hypothetical protein
MPAEVQDRVHTLARRARAHRGLTFTDSDGNDLDTMLSDSDDDIDSDFDPDDDDNSYASSEDSDYDPLDDADNDASLPGTIAGVDDAGDAQAPAEPTGVDNAIAQTTIEPPGVDDDDESTIEPPGVDNDDESNDDPPAELETFVNELETELDDEIDEIEQLDSDYNPADDDNYESNADIDAAVVTPINNDELDNIHTDAARQQSSADNDAVNDDHDEEPDDDEDSDPDTPQPRLRRNRTRSYGHLKAVPAMDPSHLLPDLTNSKEANTRLISYYKA